MFRRQSGRHVQGTVRQSCSGGSQAGVFRGQSGSRVQGAVRQSCSGGSQAVMFRGQSSGRIQRDARACFIPFSFSISMNRTVVACKRGCQALLDTGTSLLHGPRELVREIQNLIHARPIGHEVKGHCTGSLPGSPHKDQQIQPLSLFLLQHLVSCQTIGTLPPVVFTINGIDYPVPAQTYVQVRGQPWGLVLKSGTCRNSYAAAGSRPPSAGSAASLQMWLSPCGWASASQKTNHLRVKDSLGHPSF